MDRQVRRDQEEEGIRVRRVHQEEQVRQDGQGLTQQGRQELQVQQELQVLQVRRDLREILDHRVPQDLKVSQQGRRVQ
jgi:hypothetical protein